MTKPQGPHGDEGWTLIEMLVVMTLIGVLSTLALVQYRNSVQASKEAVLKALEIIKGLTAEPEVGQIYKGTVTRIVDFGAFVEILPNKEALLHVSEIAHERVESPGDVLKEGETIDVKVISIDREGKTRLTRRELLPFPEGEEGEAARERIQRAREAGPPSRDRGGRPPRGGDRGDRGGRPPRGDRPRPR